MLSQNDGFAAARRRLMEDVRAARRRKRVPDQVVKMREMIASVDAMIEDGLSVAKHWLEGRTSVGTEHEIILPRVYNLYNADCGTPISIALIGDAANALTRQATITDQYCALKPLVSMVREGLVQGYS